MADEPRQWTEDERRAIVRALTHMTTLVKLMLLGTASEARLRHQRGLVMGATSMLATAFPNGLAATLPPEEPSAAQAPLQ